MRFLPLLFFLASALSSHSQAPSWVSSAQRTAQYPQSQYLQGYAWQSGVKKDVEEVYNRLTSQAKSELIEAIQVEVNSNSELQTKEFQDEFMSRFTSNTKTKATANIVGMKIEKYYDKKEKSAYVFAYANKNEIADYYMNEISEALQALKASERESKSFEEQGLAKEGMAALLSENKQFGRINDARNYLKALGVRSESGLKTEALSQSIKSRENQIRALLLSSKSSTDALAYYLTALLSDQHQINLSSTEVNDFVYSDSPLKSDFSNKLKSSFLTAIGEVKADSKNKKLSSAQMSGKFQEDGMELIVSVILEDKSNKYSAETRFSKTAAGDWEPSGMKFLRECAGYKFIPSTTLLQSQCLERIKEDLKIETTDGYKRVGNFAIALNNVSTEEIVRTVSDASGIASFKAYKVLNCKPVQILFVEPDLASILNIDARDPYIDRVRKEYDIPREKILLKVSPTLVYLQSKELFDGKQLDAKAIEPLVKEKLSNAGFELTSEIERARFQIDINATARKGGNIQGLYFSYLDAALSVMDLRTGTEIINQAFSGEKQGGSSFEQAAMNAFKKTGEQMVDELSTKLFND